MSCPRLRPARLAADRFFLLLLATAGLGACGAPATPEPPGALRYGVPTADPLIYSHSDSAVVEVSAGGQAFDVVLSSDARWQMAFEAGDPLTVTASLLELDARVRNPMAGSQTADASGVDGSLVFTLSPRGEGTLVERPEISGTAAEFVTASSLVHHFFPRLPARAVAEGETWSDTVRYAMEETAGPMSATVALRYTAAGDTVVDGRSYRLVRFEGEDRREAEGTTQGMAFTQEVSGTVTGHFLWDARRRLIEEVVQRSDMEGTMEVAMAPVPLDLRVRATVRVALVEEGG